MTKLINLIPNSSFEELSYDINATNINDRIKIDGWAQTNKNCLCDKQAYNGQYSLLLTDTNTLLENVITSNLKSYKCNHIHYFRIYYYLQGDVTKTKTYRYKIIDNDTNILPVSQEFTINATSNKWLMVSDKINPTDVNRESLKIPKIQLELANTSNENFQLLIDSILLIDLSEAFGIGHEPSVRWCDENIPYFETEYDIELLPKEIKFTCKDQFVYSNDTKKYYTDNYSPEISFLVKNIDRYYDADNNIRIDCTIYNKNNERTGFETISLNNLSTKYIDNTCYASYNFTFHNGRHHATFTVYSDSSGEAPITDTLTVYFIGKYNNEDNLQYNLDFNLSYASTYLRKLKGTTNAYDDVPMTVDVFINGVKTSPVNILNKDNNATVFEKDLYLSDGNNVIEVVVTDICGNSRRKSSTIYVDCMPPIPEKKELLTNFVANDDLNLSLHLGNADLKYETKDAGVEKEVLIDTSINSHYFKLFGENAKLYRISKDNIPKIQGDIIKRPLSITFDYVEKIYDGTNDITGEIRKLKLDDGYYLQDVHKEYNDYAGTGLVRSTFERKVTSEIMYNQHDVINKDYVIEKPNVDYKNVYINIDGVEGYSLYDESSDSAHFIFNDINLNNWFETVLLIRDNDKTIVRFVPTQNNELKYKVSNEVNIKYNYSINSDSEYVTYKTSDVGFVQVNFSNAFFETKDVTDEIQPITLNNIKFDKDVLGDASNNYQIANYSSTGRILRRTINPHIECFDKVYDGSPIIPFKMSEKFYNGLENSISGDDVFIDTTFEGDRNSETHIFTKNGSTVLVADNSDVGTNKDVRINSIFLEGHDAKNYKIGKIISNYNMSITKRPISVVINKIRLIRATRQWEIDYTILNDIKTDKLSIVYNSNSNLSIKVYGGINDANESIHTDYDGKLDILSMFFNYSFNNTYQFNDINSEVQMIKDNMAYWKNEARPAEPDTERIDVDIDLNDTYPGEIKLSLGTLSNGIQTSYFESENKDYKLYSGCKVMVTNINLNPLNDKINNYTLLNSTCETEIEII